MRLYRLSFLCGLATGYVLGARGGREQYDRMVKIARQVADHPTVQQAAGAMQAQAARLAKTGADSAKAQLRARTPKLMQPRTTRARGARTGSRRREAGNGPAGNGSAGADGSADALNGSYHRQRLK